MLTVRKNTSTCTLQADVLFYGDDVLVAITGGAAHIGSFSIASPGDRLVSKEYPYHKDAKYSDLFATEIEKHIQGKAVVVCGVHVDNITQKEIEELDKAADQLLENLIQELALSIIPSSAAQHWPRSNFTRMRRKNTL